MEAAPAGPLRRVRQENITGRATFQWLGPVDATFTDGFGEAGKHLLRRLVAEPGGDETIGVAYDIGGTPVD